MLRLRDIMSRDVLTVTPDTTVRDAMELLAVRHVSGAPVIAGGAVVGVISSSDLLLLAGTLPAVPTDGPPGAADGEVEWRAGNVELDGPAGASALDMAAWAEPAELDGPVSAHYPTDRWTELPADAGDGTSRTAGPEWSPLDEHTVSEAMTRNVVALPPDADVTEAAALMERSGIHRVLVMDEGELVGIVSTLDVVRAVAGHQIRARRYVFGAAGPRDDREDADA